MKLTTHEKIIVGSIIGGVVVFVLTTMASSWWRDNYEFKGFNIINKNKDDKTV